MTLYSTAKLKIEKDLDLEDEEFVQPSEMMEYFNDGLREAQQEVLTIYEDYFLTKAYLPLVNGTSTYSLPSDIYANKIRGIIYQNSDLIYEIKRIRTPHKFLDRHILRFEDPTDYYTYILLNDSTSGFQIEISPVVKETSSTNVTIWYLRDIAMIDSDSDYVDKDIPECLNFIYAYVKAQCLKKENGGIMPDDARASLEQQRKLLVDTLTNMIPDDDNEIIKDMSFYEEIS